jgi:sporulation protein YunB
MFDHPILNEVGPDLRINLQLVGSIKTDVISTVKPHGINNSLVEVVIETTVTFQVLIPFKQGEITVVTHTPLLIRMIQGDIPYYYYYSGGSGPNTTPPRHDDQGGQNGDNGGGLPNEDDLLLE